MKHLPALLLVALHSLTAHADVKLPAVFSDHMVLQSDAALAMWGWADAGEAVSVSIAGQSQTATAGADGKWLVKLGKLKATGEPQKLIVKGRNTLSVDMR